MTPRTRPQAGPRQGVVSPFTGNVRVEVYRRPEPVWWFPDKPNVRRPSVAPTDLVRLGWRKSLKVWWLP